MRRKEIKAKTITQSNDASSITNKRGMARRAKRTSGKKLRQATLKELTEQAQELKMGYSDPLKPNLQLLVKLGSTIVHAEEYLSPGGHPVDKAAMDNLLRDPDIREWVEQMTKMALLPAKR